MKKIIFNFFDIRNSYFWFWLFRTGPSVSVSILHSSSRQWRHLAVPGDFQCSLTLPIYQILPGGLKNLIFQSNSAYPNHPTTFLILSIHKRWRAERSAVGWGWECRSFSILPAQLTLRVQASSIRPVATCHVPHIITIDNNQHKKKLVRPKDFKKLEIYNMPWYNKCLP